MLIDDGTFIPEFALKKLKLKNNRKIWFSTRPICNEDYSFLEREKINCLVDIQRLNKTRVANRNHEVIKINLRDYDNSLLEGATKISQLIQIQRKQVVVFDDGAGDAMHVVLLYMCTHMKNAFSNPKTALDFLHRSNFG